MTPTNLKTSSTPAFHEFDPRAVPYQAQVIDDIWNNYDYSIGTHDVMLSGSVGSAKSILLAHIASRYCIENSGAAFGLFRRSMPDLKDTLFLKVVQHLQGSLREGVDFKVNYNRAQIHFRNKSAIISRSWADKNYQKVRSLELCGAAIEELVENTGDDWEIYGEIRARIGRQPHVPRPILISATNPDSPSHEAYDYFIGNPTRNRHVYYSVTTDNPFLPDSYIEGLRANYDPQMVRRMIHGEWLEISKEMIYYAYDTDKQYLRGVKYDIKKDYPIFCSWDFNIGMGKPMSVVLFQYIDKVMHIFAEVVVHGMRTEDSCQELAVRGFLDHDCLYYITGDASGKHADTRNTRSDYDIIKKFFANYKSIRYDDWIYKSNTYIRERHNLVNAHCLNDLGEIRLYIYDGCPMADKALRLTQLKKGANIVEDDSQEYQHISTAIGYGLRAAKDLLDFKPTTQYRV